MYPNAGQLIAGVARFLKEDVRAATDDPAVRFRALVAANMLRMVATEMAQDERKKDPAAAEPTGASPEALLQRLRAELQAVNPRFDLRDDIETQA